MPVRYSVKDVEAITGIAAPLLRTWEKRYGFPNPQRKENKFRTYSDKELVRLLQFQILNKKGYKISELVKYSEEEIRKLIEEQLLKDNHFPDKETLYYVLTELNEKKFNEIVSKSIRLTGFENTFENVLFPFLRYVGDLWFMKIISPVHEHFVSNLIRQKLFRAIDDLTIPEKYQDDRVWIFFLNAYEMHEIALMYYYYLTKKAGKRAIYLGQCVPVEDLINAARFYENKTLITVFTAPLKNITLEGYIEHLRKNIKNSTLYFSGSPDLISDKYIEWNHYFKNPDEFKKLII
jgi:DNA-binding transcriptional MerR regulator